MMFRKYKIGQPVGYRSRRKPYAPQGTFIVTALLPERDGAFEYRIRHQDDGRDHVVTEDELYERRLK
jgi:hypothetical protein